MFFRHEAPPPHALLSLLSLAESSRYEGGPHISFRSPSSRITGTLAMNKCQQNMVDRTSEFNVLFPIYSLSVGDDMNYSIVTSNPLAPGEKGTCIFNNAKTEIDLRKSGKGNSIRKILRLTAKDLHASQEDMNGDLIEYQLRQLD